MKVKLIIIVAIFLLLTVPLTFAQVGQNEPRELQGVRLADTRYTEISFYNAAQDLQLGGMLFVPEGKGPFPALVVIRGSGTSRRDNAWYLTLTQYLQEQGVAVLLPDKRGSGKSAGDWRTATFADLATDTLAAVAYLQKQQRVPITQIGIVGMSQGGHYAPLVARHSPDVDFLVNVVGAAVPIHQQLRYEENHNLRQIGLLPGISNLAAYPAAWSIREVRQQTFWEAIGNYDPLPDWEALNIEALVLYGGLDTNVPSQASAARLRSLDKANIEVRIYEGSGHALEDPPGQGNRIFREDALQDIKTFIFNVTRQG